MTFFDSGVVSLFVAAIPLLKASRLSSLMRWARYSCISLVALKRSLALAICMTARRFMAGSGVRGTHYCDEGEFFVNLSLSSFRPDKSQLECVEGLGDAPPQG